MGKNKREKKNSSTIIHKIWRNKNVQTMRLSNLRKFSKFVNPAHKIDRNSLYQQVGYEMKTFRKSILSSKNFRFRQTFSPSPQKSTFFALKSQRTSRDRSRQLIFTQRMSIDPKLKTLKTDFFKSRSPINLETSRKLQEINSELISTSPPDSVPHQTMCSMSLAFSQ